MKFTYLLIFTVLLSGCAKKDPIESVVNHHQEHIGEVIDYAKNNFVQTNDVIFLENELAACSLAMSDVLQVHYGQIATCKAKTDYWRLATFGTLLALAGVILILIKRILK